MPTPPPRLMLPAQITATFAAILIVIFTPPASGRLLLVPIGGGDPGPVAVRALHGGALLLGAGPLSGSIVVVGERSAVAKAIGGAAIMILAAPSGGCTSTVSA